MFDSRSRKLFMRRSAFTLIELLLALTLTGLIVAISGQLAFQMAQTGRTADVLTRKARQHLLWDQVISEDFRRLLPESLRSKLPLVLTEGSVLVLELPVLAMIPVLDQSLHTPLRPCSVRYVREAAGDLYTLKRQIIDITDPARVFPKEEVATHVEEFKLEVRRKGEWVKPTEANPLENKEVEAVHIEVRTLGAEQLWAKTFRLNHAKQN